MWQLVTWYGCEEQRVFVDKDLHTINYEDEDENIEVIVRPEDCYWKWWDIDFGYISNPQPYEVDSTCPDFDPTIQD